MLYTAKIIIIVGDSTKTKFMQAADLFTKDKVLGKQHEIEVKFEMPEFKWEFDYAQTLVDRIAELFMKDKKFILSFVHLFSVKNDEVIMFNNNKVKPYINKKVRQISNGNKFYIFANYLKNIGLEVETDNYFFIK